jgi:hypothetical protein
VGESVSEYVLTDPAVLRLAEGVFALTYLAQWKRAGAKSASAPEEMYVTSIWRREGQGWLNVFSQDTAVSRKQVEVTASDRP